MWSIFNTKNKDTRGHRSGVFIVNIEYISSVGLVFILDLELINYFDSWDIFTAFWWVDCQWNSFTTKVPLIFVPTYEKELFRKDECKIVDFDISDAKEKHEKNINEIQDIKSHVQEHEEVDSPHVQQIEDDKTINTHFYILNVILNT